MCIKCHVNVKCPCAGYNHESEVIKQQLDLTDADIDNGQGSFVEDLGADSLDAVQIRLSSFTTDSFWV